MKVYIEAITEQEICHFESVLSKRGIAILKRKLVKNVNDGKLYYRYEIGLKGRIINPESKD